MSARRVLAIAFFLFLAADGDCAYSGKYFAPLGLVGDAFMYNVPYKIGIANHIVIALLLFGRSNSTAEWVRPMRRALGLCAVTLVTEFLWGLACGGVFRCGYWQIYYIWSGLLFGYCVASVCPKARDFGPLLSAIVYAAGYRAVMCSLYWLLYVHTGEWKTENIVSHDDTVLEIAAILIVLLRLIQGSKKRLGSIAYIALQLAAILFNNRRLAWLSLAMALVFLLFLLPPSRAKRRVVRTALVAAPILYLYVAIGAGRSETIFKPVQSFASTAEKEDASTKARNVENLGLIATSLASNRVLGSGWGHPYIEVANWYSIAQYFPLWQYIPHDSVLGILAFTGVFGFAGFWLAFPTAIFINARLARFGAAPLARQLGTLGALELIVVGNQMYGDMGTYYVRPMLMLGFSYAIALRLPIEAGAWPSSRRPRLDAAPQPGLVEAGEPAVPQQPLGGTGLG